jgi:hypothetical protein
MGQTPLKVLVTTVLAAAALHLLFVYAVEWRIAEGLALLEGVLRGRIFQADAPDAVLRARALGEIALHQAPEEPRAALVLGSALTMLAEGEAARIVLDQAVRLGERPELLVALGRARAATGDDNGAKAAFLRAAWASPPSINTLPKAPRQEILEEVLRQETELRSGRLKRSPSIAP